jgi:hypothetical protein
MELRGTKDLTEDPLFVRFYVTLKIIVWNVISAGWWKFTEISVLIYKVFS